MQFTQAFQNRAQRFGLIKRNGFFCAHILATPGEIVDFDETCFHCTPLLACQYAQRKNRGRTPHALPIPGRICHCLTAMENHSCLARDSRGFNYTGRHCGVGRQFSARKRRGWGKMGKILHCGCCAGSRYAFRTEGSPYAGKTAQSRNLIRRTHSKNWSSSDEVKPVCQTRAFLVSPGVWLGH